MNKIFRDLRDARRTVVDDVLPGLVGRGERLEVVSDSVSHLLRETYTLRNEAERVRRSKERSAVALGICCLCACLFSAYLLLCDTCRQKIVDPAQSLHAAQNSSSV